MNRQAFIITPLSEQQQQQVIKETRAYIKTAEQHYALQLKPVEIVFNLKGRAAGMYRVHTQRGLLQRKIKRELRYNPFIFAKYFDDNFTTTIPHEVAHYVTDLIYGLRNIKPHGSEWQQIMAAFNADASVTASYDLDGIPRRQQTLFRYYCACGEHQIGSIRHKRIQRQQRQYYCRSCKQVLSPQPQKAVLPAVKSI